MPPPLPNPSIPAEESEKQELAFRSRGQLITFRETATKIAEDFLNTQGIKLYRGRSTTSVIRNWEAYAEGVKDGKKIDLRRKKIKHGNATGETE